MIAAVRHCASAAGALALLCVALAATAPLPAWAAPALTQVGPVPPNSDVAFFVREDDVRKVPAPGVVVTMTVVSGGADGAVVAPAQRPGTATGPAGASARSTSDRLGNAYFLIHAARRTGTDMYAWDDGHGHTGQVALAVSTAATPPAAAVGASAVAGPSASSSARPGVAAASAHPASSPPSSTPWWRTLLTGILAVLVAGALVFWLPRLARRRATRHP